MSEQISVEGKGEWLRLLTNALAFAVFLLAAWLLCNNESGGFLPNFGALLAALVVFAGNLIVLGLNLLRWLIYGSGGKARSILLFQLALAVVVGLYIYLTS